MYNLTIQEKQTLKNLIHAAINGEHVTITDESEKLKLRRVLNELENNADNQIAIIWSIEDVQQERPDLSDEQAMEVLKKVKDKHDATIGVNWDVLRNWADELYPKPKTCGYCANFERYEDEDDGYGGCDAGCGTVHQDNDATQCDSYL